MLHILAQDSGFSTMLERYSGVALLLLSLILTVLWIFVPLILLQISSRLGQCVERLDALNRSVRLAAPPPGPNPLEHMRE